MKNEHTSQLLKQSNQIKIIRLLLEKTTMNQVDISGELSLSLPTVISNVNDLTNEGILSSDRVGNSRGGRKPVVVSIQPNYKYTVGIDFLVDTVKISIFDFCMSTIETEEFSTSRFIDFDQIMEKIFRRIKDMLLKRNITISKVIGIGISIPGIVNEQTKTIEVVPNLHITDKKLKTYNGLFEVPVYFENEANSAAYAEWKIGAAKDAKEVLHLSIMKGVGAGIVINNRLYHGTHFKAGEVGHFIIHRNGRKCTCGEYGCVNEYLSVESILKTYAKRTGKHLTRLQDFMDALARKELPAQKIWGEYIDDFAFTIKTIISTIDPQTIVIGGEIANYSNLLIPQLHKNLKESKSTIIKKDNHIVASQLMEHASILGVSLYLRNKYISNFSIQQ